MTYSDGTWDIPPSGAYASVFTPETYGAIGYSTVTAAVASGTDNEAALTAMFAAAAAVGGKVVLGWKYYPCATTPQIAGSCAVEGAGCFEVGWDGYLPATAPFLAGSVILITGGAQDGLRLSGTGAVVPMKGFGILFAPSIMFSNTGHGIVFEASATGGGGHEFGLAGSTVQDVKVFGHDGNHYGRYVVNQLSNQWIGWRSYGGGDLFESADSTVGIFGNSSDFNCYGCGIVAGTAHGYAFSALTARGGGNGGLNLREFTRPQFNFADYSANATLGNPTKPTTSQYLWQAAAGANNPAGFTVVAPDLEADDSVAHPINWGTFGVNYTVVVGTVQTSTTGTVSAVAQAEPSLVDFTNNNLISGPNAGNGSVTGAHNTGSGPGVFAALSSGAHNTAHGDSALTALQGGSQNTAVGDSALKALVGGNYNTALGWQAGQSAVSTTQAVFVGAQAGASATGNGNVHIGYQAGYTGTSGAFATTTAYNQVFIGELAGQSSATQSPKAIAIGGGATINGTSAIAIGYGAAAGAAGAVAIGSDSTGVAASAGTANYFVLGTVNHKPFIPGLVTADPHVVGQLWANAGVVTVSAG